MFKNQIKPLVMGLVLGAVLSAVLSQALLPSREHPTASVAANIEAKPLYWVAPMDASYRRDKPGKSPMGMDLVPVYPEDARSAQQHSVGTIEISPDVINKLGVTTTAVVYQLPTQHIDTVGYVSYDEDKLVHIHPRVQGWIEKLYVKAIGDPVVQGQPLYDIYAPELVNAQQEFLLALEHNNPRLIDAAKIRLQALQIPATAIAALTQRKKVNQYVTVLAPQNGVVELLNIREGFYVKPDTSMLAIGDLSEVWVEAEVFERQAAQVKKGAPVTMQLDYLPGQTWQGKVDYIYPTLDAKTRTLKLRLRFNNPDGLFKPNMFAQIRIELIQQQMALLIPKQALIRTGSQDRVVLALGAGRFKSIAVTTGRFDEQSVEILTGLEPGDFIVSSAQFLLDSESSKSSDFVRYYHQNKAGTADISTESTQPQHAVNVQQADSVGEIMSIMPEHGMLSINRAAIEKWQRPAQVVDFVVKPGLDLTEFKAGQQVAFSFEIHGEQFVISKIAIDAGRE